MARLLPLSLSLWAGCQGGNELPTCEGTELTLALGTGEFGYEPIDDGARVTLINGPQGGWHVWTSGQVTAPGPRLSLHARVVDEQSSISLAGSDDLPVTLDLSEPGTGTWDEQTCSGAFYGQFAYLDDAQPRDGDSYLDLICMLEGRPLAFSATITEEGGGEASSSARVRAELDPKNVPYCREH